ncbi:MAG: hypothetical protein JXN63_08395 [Candidatus Delongbacteria bacterium]|nr:hypothetical protein [Candidatus Delongbacteria bacterium]
MYNRILIYTVFFTSFFAYAHAGDLKQLAKLFAEDVKYAPRDTYEEYISSRGHGPVFISERKIIEGNSDRTYSKAVSKIMVLTESGIYPDISTEVQRYINDIHNVFGCTVVSFQISSSISAELMKDLIISENDSGAIDGAVLIGDLPAAWFEVENDFNEYGYAEFPCDLFLMDLDGSWIDSDSNGKYNSHTGLVNPEVFVGRISTANMGDLTSEIQGMKDYLDKNHNFWTGVTSVNLQKGLTYTDRDWMEYSDFLYDISNLYSLFDAVSAYNSYFGKIDYLGRLSGGTYEFVQLSCHSNWTLHRMYGPTPEDSEDILTNEIFSLPLKSIAYNLFCCSGVRWTNTDYLGFLGGAYVYNTDSKALVSTGSTKTGSMLGFSYFYSPLQTEKVFGTALKQWWVNYVGTFHDFDEICWFYGMSIIGDPMIDPKYVAPAAPAVPLNVTTSVSGTDIYIFWDAVSGAASYKIYGSDDPYAPDPWTLLDSVSGTSYIYSGTENRKFFKIIASTDSVIRQNR